MNQQALLITQCLQNDFVKLLGPHQPLPNQLHVGYDEALRLMGENPGEGPVAMMMGWAYQQPEERLKIIHIRDWHNPSDPFQEEHLRQFGSHCVAGSDGAAFAFAVDEGQRGAQIINAAGLSDFVGTGLYEMLIPYAGMPVRAGLMGVWTEAKISFLAYDLRTRFPQMEIGVCSALTASSSRSRHFLSLEQLERLLGVRVFSSIGEFSQFLAGSQVEVPLPAPKHEDRPLVQIQGQAAVSDADMRLIKHLFRDCRQVSLNTLDGGFSGNLVFGSQSVDLHGHRQAHHVVKIGPQAAIGKERAAFEQVEDVLGNSAPQISDFADFGGRGALKYRYAAMGGGFSTTFQKQYSGGLPIAKIERMLTTVFSDQLGRLYAAASLERANLLDYYWFTPERGERVRAHAEAILGKPARGNTLRLPSGQKFPNPAAFYTRDLPELLPRADGSAYFSFVHGDLNGANIIIDSHENVWLIDFFHTGRGHVLKDLIKLENDLLYIFTTIADQQELAEALQLTDLLLEVEDLGRPLPAVDETGLTLPQMRRAYQTVRCMRSFYPNLIALDRTPLQLFIGQLRYAAHTLSFDECSHLQKCWALYAAGRLGEKINAIMRGQGPLRVDWLDPRCCHPGGLGITILPGRKDHRRSLERDLAALKNEGVTHVVCLATDEELARCGVPQLIPAYQEAGLSVRRLPIRDQGVSSAAEMADLTSWMEQQLMAGARIMIHCVGGLGRSGVAAASYLMRRGYSASQAIDAVRRARSQRAIESEAQERFLESWTADGQ